MMNKAGEKLFGRKKGSPGTKIGMQVTHTTDGSLEDGDGG
jgi:hypothetical protein